MSDTPRTDDRIVFIDGNPWVNAPFAQSLERELNAAHERIKRLEELGKELRECASWVGHACCQYVDQIRRASAAIETWDKEAKP